jgi:hypothetical protein
VLLRAQFGEATLILLPNLSDSALMHCVMLMLVPPHILKEYSEFFFLLFSIAHHCLSFWWMAGASKANR